MVEIKSYIQWKNRVYISICGNNFLESAPQKKTKSFIKTLKIPVF